MADFGIGEALTAASIAASVGGGVMGVMQAGAQRAAQQNAYNQSVDIANQNLARQQQSVNMAEASQEKQAVQAKSDEMMRADAQLGTVRVMAGEMGASGGTLNQLVQQNGYQAGADTTRTEQNYETQFTADELQKQGYNLDYQGTTENLANTLTGQEMQDSNAMFSAGLGALGTSLSIGGSAYRSAKIDAAMNSGRLTSAATMSSLSNLQLDPRGSTVNNY